MAGDQARRRINRRRIGHPRRQLMAVRGPTGGPRSSYDGGPVTLVSVPGMASPQMRTNRYVDGVQPVLRLPEGHPAPVARPRRLVRADAAHERRAEGVVLHGPVAARPGKLHDPVHQDAYLRALATLPTAPVHLGRFLAKPLTTPLANPAPGGAKFVEVLRTEEKGLRRQPRNVPARGCVPRRSGCGGALTSVRCPRASGRRSRWRRTRGRSARCRTSARTIHRGWRRRARRPRRRTAPAVCPRRSTRSR